MKTSNQEILDSYIRHQIYILRYAGGLRNTAGSVLVKTENDLYDLILKYMAKVDGNRFLGDSNIKKLTAQLTEDVKALRLPAWENISSQMVSEVQSFALAEAAGAAATIQAATPVLLGLSSPPTAQLLSVVNSQPFEGKTLKQWVSKNSSDDVERILNYAKVGVVQGRAPTAIAREIAAGQSYPKAVARKAIRDIESVMLTVTNGVQQEAKQALYEANSDILKEEVFVSTLDSRTTLICASEDNKVYPRGTGPIPPLHFRCRSLRAPFLNPDNFGDRPFNAATQKQLLGEFTSQNKLGTVRSRDALPRGYKTKYDDFVKTRRSDMIGNVPARTTFSSWLKTQPKSFQDDYLGPARAEMFREDNLTLDYFVDNSGSTLTLEQLNKKH